MFGHSHHSHAPHAASHRKSDDYGQAFKIGIALNTLFVAAEIIYGLKANSLSLLADAGHNAGDVIGLILAWGATLLMKRKPSERFTYGLQSSSMMAALANAVLLLVAVGAIGWEAIQRFSTTSAVAPSTVMVVALIGVVINGSTALLFMAGRKKDLNVYGAFIHLAADAVISLGVVFSSLLMMWKSSWFWIDPVVSLAISVAIIIGTWGLLRDSINLILHAVPGNINFTAVKAYFEKLEGVDAIHDLHIWAMSTTEVALSIHLVMRGGHPGDAFLDHISHVLEHDFHISHATFQIELGDSGTVCKLATEHMI